MTIKPKNLVLYGVGIAIFFTIAYIVTLIQIRNCNCDLTLNAFGDYIGGIFNPIFTLLSTIAIAILTYFIAVRDDDKAKESLEIQKKVTLIQLRQKAFDDLLSSLSQPRTRYFESQNITRRDVYVVGMDNRKRIEDKEIDGFWFRLIGSLDIFQEQNHLFQNLLENAEFKEQKLNVRKHLVKMRAEEKQGNLKDETLLKYIDDMEKLCQSISDFIIKDF